MVHRAPARHQGHADCCGRRRRYCSNRRLVRCLGEGRRRLTRPHLLPVAGLHRRCWHRGPELHQGLSSAARDHSSSLSFALPRSALSLRTKHPKATFHASVVSWPNWIRRLPTEQETAGSSPAETLTVFLLLLSLRLAAWQHVHMCILNTPQSWFRGPIG